MTVVALALSACGGSSYMDDLANTVTTDLMTDGELPDFVDDELANCMATNLVDQVGEEQLQADAVTTENVVDYLETHLVANPTDTGSMFQCLDRDQTVLFMTDLFGVDEAAATCILDAVGDDALAQAISLTDKAAAAFQTCAS